MQAVQQVHDVEACTTTEIVFEFKPTTLVNANIVAKDEEIKELKKRIAELKITANKSKGDYAAAYDAHGDYGDNLSKVEILVEKKEGTKKEEENKDGKDGEKNEEDQEDEEMDKEKKDEEDEEEEKEEEKKNEEDE
ncbi:hypothetical protein CDL12_28518 [Handroanthus impetiginosus]|uniref:Uncharacterized protein n=1 Tax=Handroanthus impetiginosus TaxID=429701 RepID=A0A2G9G109_9LAMI|nr:hypothetical protein CDL12_28518 [Handroanthus impetiginosus]